ncbi:MAG: phosphate ABC transporter substrate-binding protein [Pseudomonadota bacterium]
MKTAWIPCCLALLLTAFAALPVAAQTTRLKVVGSGTQKPLTEALARRFEALHRGVSIRVEGGGTQHAVDEIRAGRADIGMMSRLLSATERDLVAFAVARDGMAFVVHRDNPVVRLTQSQLRSLYTGRISQWQQVGGQAVPVQPFTRDKGRSSQDLFQSYTGLSGEEVQAAIISGDNDNVLKTVPANPHALAYLSLGEAERGARNGLPIKLLEIDGIAATSRNVRKGSYPILRPLTLVTKQLPRGVAKQFIDFCLSSQANDTILQHDFVPYID